jgi:putative hemolysin
MTTQLLVWLLFALCLALSFLMSGMEAGVFALSRLRIRQLMRQGRSSARVLYGYLEHPENFLWTIFVGNTVANLIILGLVVTVLHSVLRHHQFWFIFTYSVIVFLFYAFFDLLPKMLFRTYPNRLSVGLARPFRLIYLLLRPMVALVESSSRALLRWRGGTVFTGRLFGNREELRQVMQESEQAFTSEERTMIKRVLDLQAITVRQAMKPLAEAVIVNAATPLNEALALCRERKLTRLPVREARDGQERIVGLLNLNTVLFQEPAAETKKVADYITPALYLDEDLRLEVALRRMQKSGQRLGIVLGREKREIGILSLQDVLNVIFGKVSL